MTETFKRFIGFFLAGGAATIINYTIFLLLLGLGVNVLFASAIGYSSGIAVSYLINAKLNFKGSKISVSGFVRYAGVYLLALPMQLVLLATFIKLGASPELANAIAILVVLILNFVVIRKLVFGSISGS